MSHAHAMGRTATIVTSLVACASALAPAAARAAPSAVDVRIEGRTKTLFEGPNLTEGHDVSSYRADGGNGAEDIAEHSCDGINHNDPENTEPGPTPTAAAVDAMDEIGEGDAMAGQWYGDGGLEDYFVKQWGAEAENAETEGRAWGLTVDNTFTNVGGCQYELHTGAEVLWTYNAFESRPFLALFASEASYAAGERPLTATAQLGEPFEVEVLAYGGDQEDAPPAEPEREGAEPFAGASVAPASTSAEGFESVELESPQAVVTDAQGKAAITFRTPGWHRLMAGAPVDAQTGEEEAIRSNRLDVCVPAEGASGCGELPVEDRLRVPPRYRGAIGAAPENWSAPRIDGTARVGGHVAAGEGLWTGEEPVTYTYRWQRCDASGAGCEDVAGATSETYEVSGADEGHTLRAVVTARNAAGVAETPSAATSEVPAPGGPQPEPTTESNDAGVTQTPIVHTLPAIETRVPARVTIARVVGRRLVLKVSAAGKLTVVIARRRRRDHRLAWRVLRTLAARASRAGTVTIELPALPEGTYRLGVALTGSQSVFRVLSIHRR